LHRKLEELGVTNYVVCPTKLDSRGKGVNNDSRDALELLVRLDRYVAGNRKAFSVVRVPTPEQEQKRALARQRDQLRRKRLSLAAQGRMLLLGQGFRQSNSWWQDRRWEKLHVQLPVWLVQRLEVFRRLIDYMDQEVEQLTQQGAAAAPQSLPVGMGRLTHEVIASEMKDFKHFQNRRQVGQLPGPDRRGQQQRGAARRKPLAKACGLHARRWTTWSSKKRS
jgi:transposase